MQRPLALHQRIYYWSGILRQETIRLANL